MRIAIFSATFASLLACALAAQPAGNRNSGLPDPPKKDVPYIIHASLLLETEVNEAKQESRKDDQLYAIPGAASPVKTPLAGPEFLFRSDAIAPDKLQLYKVDSRNGRREIVIAHKKKQVAMPIRMSVVRVHDNVFRIRVDAELDRGEYSLSPEGSDTVFCFAVE
jgi:hypothetical protein